ncbi:MAG: class I SAM-dependent methyltransferase [Pirellulales bacterium]
MFQSILQFCRPPWELGQRVTTEVPCCLTGSTEAIVVATRDRHLKPLRTVISIESGLVFVDPRPATEQVQEFYEKDYRQQYKKTRTPRKRHIYRAAKAAKQRLELLERHGSPGMKLLDIGAGGGEFVYLAQQQGYDASGIEPNQGYAEYARKEYEANISNVGLQDYILPDESLDLITMFHVLEHLESPAVVVQKLVQSLKPGGKLLIEVPNVNCTRSSPWYKWHVGHLYHFNLCTLEALGRQAGLKPLYVWESKLGGLAKCVFQKVENCESFDPDALLQGNFKRTLDILQQHTPFSYLTNVQNRFERAKQKLSRRLEEKQQTIKFEKPQQILDDVANEKKAA